MNSSAPLVVVVGAGPAGLSAAAVLAQSRVCRTVVLERESELGGIPRHANHTGFGLRDLNRILSGPRYAQSLADGALRAGAEIHTSTMVTSLSVDGTIEVTSPQGRTSMRPDAVILCTGCRERSRAARLIPGSRPQGVLTTGTLQQLVYLQRRGVGRRAVIVGAEHVSYSALPTLAHAGASAVAIVTEFPAHQTYGLLALGASLRYRAPLLTNTVVDRIYGYPQLEGVCLRNRGTGATINVGCDLLVLTGDWVPDNELALQAGVATDPSSFAPLVDTALRTLRPGLFAAGNLIHPAEMADVVALAGRHVAASVIRYLRSSGEWPSPIARIESSALRWIAPQLIAADYAMPSRQRLLIRASEARRNASITISQGDADLWRGRRRLVPNRSAWLPATWVTSVCKSDVPVTVRVASSDRSSTP